MSSNGSLKTKLLFWLFRVVFISAWLYRKLAFTMIVALGFWNKGDCWWLCDWWRVVLFILSLVPFISSVPSGEFELDYGFLVTLIWDGFDKLCSKGPEVFEWIMGKYPLLLLESFSYSVFSVESWFSSYRFILDYHPTLSGFRSKTFIGLAALSASCACLFLILYFSWSYGSLLIYSIVWLSFSLIFLTSYSISS